MKTDPAWIRYLPKSTNVNGNKIVVEPESIPSKHKPVLRRSSNRFGPYNVVQPITKVKRKFNDQDDIDNSEMTDCEKQYCWWQETAISAW